jgi:hypothetical protein
MTQKSSRHGVATLDSPRPPPDVPSRHARLPGLDPRSDRPAADLRGRDLRVEHLRHALASRSSQALEIAEEGLQSWAGVIERVLANGPKDARRVQPAGTGLPAPPCHDEGWASALPKNRFAAAASRRADSRKSIVWPDYRPGVRDPHGGDRITEPNHGAFQPYAATFVQHHGYFVSGGTSTL